MNRIRSLVYLCVCLVPLCAAADNSFYLKNGDRVVFYGDSITEQRLYTSYVETYVVTRFPKMRVEFTMSGWGGDRVDGGFGGDIETRLQRDVFAYNPTVVTIMLDMNDGRYRPFDEQIFEAYAKGLTHIVQAIKNKLPGVRITLLIEPSPFDDVTRPPQFPGGYNKVLLRYAQFVKELADREHLTVADMNAPVVAMLERAKTINPQLAQKILPDRVHPAPGGHLIMAEALLKAWNAPSVITDVEIDASRLLTERQVNTSAVAIWKNGDSFSWVQEDRALPMPFDRADSTVDLALRSSDLLNALDRQLLTVTGLKTGDWRLHIDGETVGTFSAQQLTGGIDIINRPTPMFRQAS